jgi:indolepyruvate ferredoxin oxidoreductase
MTGLAQKGGAVFSHVRVASAPDQLHAVRIAAGAADLVLGTDFLTTGSGEALAKMRLGHTAALVNRHQTMTADFARRPDLQFPDGDLEGSIRQAVGEDVTFFDATAVATALLGDAIATNPLMLGFAAQRGLLPVGLAAIERAIELNGVALDLNRQALLWGRRAGHDLAAVLRVVERLSAPQPGQAKAATLDEAIERRVAFLTAYQDARYAERYRQLVADIRAAELARAGTDRFTHAVARSAFKLMAYKDEYEVARLYSDGAFKAQVAQQFEGATRLTFHLAPPVLSETGTDGRPRKRTFGPWTMTAFRLLAKLKGLRGTAFDPFGRTEERRTERQLIGEYEALVRELAGKLESRTLDVAVDLAALPEQIRGFGPVKARNLAVVKVRQAELLKAFRSPAPPALEAAE